MNEFEKRLADQPQREIPEEWRQEILSAARQASRSHPAPRDTRLSLGSVLSSFVWPCPQAWAGLAAVWLAILTLNIATQSAPQRVVTAAQPASPQLVMNWLEQKRFLAELIGPAEKPVAERPRRIQPRPRSERGTGFLMV